MKRDTSEANHIVDYQMGGEAKTRVRLPVLKPVDEDLSYELRRQRRLYGAAQEAPFKEAIPRNRSECPDVRPCRFFCKHNTWVVSGLDQPGRRWVDGSLPPTQVNPTTDYNCTLDLAEAAHEKETVTPAMIAATLGISDRQARRYKEDALAALPSVLQQALENEEQRAAAVSVLCDLMANGAVQTTARIKGVDAVRLVRERKAQG